MKLSHAQNVAIDAAIEALWSRTQTHPGTFPTVVPLYELLDGLGNVRCLEFAGLNWKIVLQQLEREAHTSLELQADPEAPLAGFVFANFHEQPFDAFLFVNASDPVARRRFSVAHEIAHLLLHSHEEDSVFYEGLSFAFTPDAEQRRDKLEAGQSLTLPQNSSNAPTETAREREADAFAARLLMPAATCQRLWDLHCERFDHKPELLARRLASDLLVSPLAAKIRLRELGRLA